MNRTALKMSHALLLVIVGMLAVGPAAADKPSNPGEGKGKKSEHTEKSKNKSKGEKGGHDDKDQPKIKQGEYFGDRHRTVVYEYYGEQYRRGHCPPGLAKKHNGCMPPGHAKKWAVGKPLPREVIYYDVPHTLVVQMQQPSAGYRYVRVASDILLIAIGSGMVIDAIQDLGRQ